MRDRELHCDLCQGVMVFDVPPCVDGHGVDCPELVCTGCGTALLAAPAPTVPVLPRGRLSSTRRRPAPARRTAA